jgi:hypothetical protein
LGAVQERWVWAGAVIIASATRSLQFSEASAATLSQQEKNNSADVRRGRVNISGFICTVASKSSRRRTFDEFLSMAVTFRPALEH